MSISWALMVGGSIMPPAGAHLRPGAVTGARDYGKITGFTITRDYGQI